MSLLLAILMLTLPLAGCGSDGGRIAADSRSGVVRILALLPDLTTGEVYYATGSAFGVGKAGESTDIFVTNTSFRPSFTPRAEALLTLLRSASGYSKTTWPGTR